MAGSFLLSASSSRSLTEHLSPLAIIVMVISVGMRSPISKALMVDCGIPLERLKSTWDNRSFLRLVLTLVPKDISFCLFIACLRHNRSGFSTGAKAIKKVGHTVKSRIRQRLNPGDDIVEQLVILNGWLFILLTCFIIRTAKEPIDGDVELVGKNCEYIVGGHTIPRLPECNGPLGHVCQFSKFGLG